MEKLKDTLKILKEYREFKHNWNYYNFEERTALTNDFKERLYQLNNNSLEI